MKGKVVKKRLCAADSVWISPAPIIEAGAVRLHGLFAGSGHLLSMVVSAPDSGILK